MKTNKDLLEYIFTSILIILCIVGLILSGWVGIIRCIFGYLLILIFAGLIMTVSGYNSIYNIWKYQKLNTHHIFGKTIKWFSKYYG